MPERPFQCVPSEVAHHPLLMRVRWESHFLFYQIMMETNRYHRVAVDPENIAFSLRSRLFQSERRQKAWSTAKVAEALNELFAHGIVRRLEQAGRCWIEIALELRYEKGVNRSEGPEQAHEQELPILAEAGPELFVVPETGPPPLRRASHSSERRVDEKKSRVETSVTEPASSLTSDKALVFDRSDLLGSLQSMLGKTEWKQNGAMWRMRARTGDREARALLNALEDFAVRTPEQRAKISNRGAWLTVRYEQCLSEQSAICNRQSAIR